jgi:23S rRNA pseudouridine2605 synthase
VPKKTRRSDRVLSERCLSTYKASRGAHSSRAKGFRRVSYAGWPVALNAPLRHTVPMTRLPYEPPSTSPRHGVARVISKEGRGSRSQATRWVLEGRVSVNGVVVRDPDFSTRQGIDRIDIDGEQVHTAARRVLMLNKPRGLVTTTSDEKGRETVYRCFDGAHLPWLAPVGRLDKASEGLLLFSNDPAWAAQVTDPERGPTKTYHVQVNDLVSDMQLQQMIEGVQVEDEHLSVQDARLLRVGHKNAWLELVLAEGRNRQIRRLLSACELEVLRLIRVSVGQLVLGDLQKGAWRWLSDSEVAELV